MLEDWDPKLKMNFDREKLILPSQQIKKLNIISSDSLENENVTWTSSDNNAPIKQNGTIQIPSNYTDGKNIKITVTQIIFLM